MNTLRVDGNLVYDRLRNLNEITDILGRMREIAVRAASVDTTNLKRVSLELEFQTLKNEVTRLGELMLGDDVVLNV
ncbi:hypothetical protein CMK22_12060 [Candidatus Poribacteria bacterium]|nr:hypothetical protein [Candidatus Poribacteria bacterium]